MALTFVQSGDTGYQSSGATSTMLPANVTVGNAVALFVWVQAAGAVVTVTSPIGTFNLVTNLYNVNPQQGQWWVCNSATAAGNTVTISSSGVPYAAQATEWSGGVTSAITGNTATGTGTTVSLTTTPSQSGDVVLTGVNIFNTISAYPSSPWVNYNAGFFTAANGEAASWITTSSTSPVTATYTQSPSGTWAILSMVLSQVAMISATASLTSTFGAAGTGSAGGITYSATGSLSASFTGAAYSGTSGIPSLPLLSVQVAFNPTNVQTIPSTGWTDVTPYVRNLNSRLGRQHYLDRVESGTLSMTVNNRTGFFLNGGSTSVGGNGTGYVIQPRLPIKVTATWPVPGGTPYPIFYGIIDDISENITDELNSDMTIRATDMTKFLSLQYMSSNNFWNTYAKSTSATNWFRCDLTRQATVTFASTPSTVINPATGSAFGTGYTDYTAINNFAVGQAVSVKGLTTYNGSDQNTTSSPVVAASGSSFTLQSALSPGSTVGTGTATQTNTVDQLPTFTGTSTSTSSTTLVCSSASWIVDTYKGGLVTSGSSSATIVSNTSNTLTVSGWGGGTPSTGTFIIYGSAYYASDVGFNPNGAMVYSANGSISLANGSNAPTGYMQINDVPGSFSVINGALDFWILGQGIANQQITTVLAGSTNRCQLWVSPNGKLEAVLSDLPVGTITGASSTTTRFTFTGSFGTGRINSGDYIKISGMTAAYNGEWKVDTYSPTQIVVFGVGNPASITLRSGSGYPVLRTNVTVNDGYWHHVGFCNDSGGNLNVYADGILTPVFRGSTSFNGWSTYTNPGGGYASQPLIIGAGNLQFAEAQIPTFAGLVDEIIISNNNNYAGSSLLNELLNRYKAGTLLTQGFPVTSTPVLSGDRIAEILCIAGFGAIGTVTAGQITLNPNTYYINDSASAWVNGLSTNGFTSVEPYYWDSPVTNSTALDLIRQICDTDIGSFFQEPNGTFSFYNQNYYGTWSWDSLTNTGSWTPNNVYVPAPTGDHIWTDDTSSSYHYYGPSLQVLRDDVDTWTTVKVTPQSGTAQTYENFANEPRWGYTTLTKSGTLHTTLSLALSTATFLGNLFKTPLPRVTNVELRSETLNGANMTALLNTEFGDIVTFKRTSPNASTTGTYPSSKGQISTNMVVEYISHDFQAEPGFWHTSFILDPYPIRS
jgi:hypothetical protein